jgi:hypothetical protein
MVDIMPVVVYLANLADRNRKNRILWVSKGSLKLTGWRYLRKADMSERTFGTLGHHLVWLRHCHHSYHLAFSLFPNLAFFLPLNICGCCLRDPLNFCKTAQLFHEALLVERLLHKIPPASRIGIDNFV